MALSGYEVIGDFLAGQAGNLRSDRKQREGEQRQERLIGEQRQYEQGAQIAAEGRGEARQIGAEGRANTRRIADEQRALINGLIAAGLLAPGDTNNQLAISAAFEKTTPEWQAEFAEKKQLRDEIAKYTAAGVIDDVQIFSQDIDTLRTIANAAREGAGKEATADRTQQRSYQQSVIDENKAQGLARLSAQEKANNASYWIAEADRAASEYENAQLTPQEMQFVQAQAAQTPGAESSPELLNAALAKATDAALKSKKNAAYLRYQNAQRGAQVGAAIPKGTPVGTSVVAPAQSDEQKMEDFMGGASVAPAQGAGIGAGTMAAGLSVLPLEKAVAAIPAVSRFASVVPPVRAAVLGLEAGNIMQNNFPNNPASRVGRMFGEDVGRAMYGSLNFGPLTEAERASVRRPMVGSSVGDPYR